MVWVTVMSTTAIDGVWIASVAPLFWATAPTMKLEERRCKKERICMGSQLLDSKNCDDLEFNAK